MHSDLHGCSMVILIMDLQMADQAALKPILGDVPAEGIPLAPFMSQGQAWQASLASDHSCPAHAAQVAVAGMAESAHAPMAQGRADARAHAPGGPLHCAVVKLPRCFGKLTAQEPGCPAAPDM